MARPARRLPLLGILMYQLCTLRFLRCGSHRAERTLETLSVNFPESGFYIICCSESLARVRYPETRLADGPRRT